MVFAITLILNIIITAFTAREIIALAKYKINPTQVAVRISFLIAFLITFLPNYMMIKGIMDLFNG